MKMIAFLALSQNFSDSGPAQMFDHANAAANMIVPGQRKPDLAAVNIRRIKNWTTRQRYICRLKAEKFINRRFAEL